MPLTHSGPIVRRKLSQEVTERILREIEEGRLSAGDRLPGERELMTIYGVGRTAIREALQNLAAMGLVQISHGERAAVLSPSACDMLEQISPAVRHVVRAQPETLEHLKEARLLFEVGMAKLAARRATEQDVERLRGHVEQLRRTIAQPEQFLDADMAFHSTLAGISGNPICAAVSAAMLKWLREFHIEMVQVPGREAVTIEEHEKIVDAVASGDAAAAEEAMTAHILRANSLYWTRRPAGSQREEAGR